MTRLVAIVPIALLIAAAPRQPDSTRLVWPPAPDTPRVEYLEEIRCDELDREAGFFGKVKRFLGGAAPDEKLALPFDVLVQGRTLYMTCRNLPALVAVDLDAMSYRLYDCDDDPLACPIAVSGDGSAVFVTDSEARAVYRLSGDRLEALITEGLSRPTGIAVLSGPKRLYVVDTGDHTLKIFDYDGDLIRTVGGHGGPSEGLNYPTFAAEAGGDALLINDALNYRVKRFDADGGLIAMFGEEGDG
ncbi:MAG TPA: hypothetical protein VM118_10535, partial [Acidobacteriota bacterium]|nr:hypothetical protein [Acidobacteriota bacterium]